MKVIDIRAPMPTKFTVLLYGPSRSGKTHFAATWPRPLFLSDAVEGGWETIRHMDPDSFHEPGRYPEVVAIESPADMTKSVATLEERIKTRPGEVQTVVIDSLTFFSEQLQDWIRSTYHGEIEKNRFFVWQQMGDRLRHFMTGVNKLPINVIWICLASDTDDGRLGGPLLVGQTAKKAPAACMLNLYQHAFQANANTPPVYEIRTKKYGIYNAGGRIPLPDPLEPSYRALTRAIQKQSKVSVIPKSGPSRSNPSVVRRPIQPR